MSDKIIPQNTPLMDVFRDAARYRKVKAMEPSKLEWIAWNAHDNEHFDRLIDEIVLDNKGK